MTSTLGPALPAAHRAVCAFAYQVGCEGCGSSAASLPRLPQCSEWAPGKHSQTHPASFRGTWMGTDAVATRSLPSQSEACSSGLSRPEAVLSLRAGRRGFRGLAPPLQSLQCCCDVGFFFPRSGQQDCPWLPEGQGGYFLSLPSGIRVSFLVSPGSREEIDCLSAGTKGRARLLRTAPLTLPPFAAEFTGPPQKPPRLGAQVCVGFAEAGNEFEPGLPKTEVCGL